MLSRFPRLPGDIRVVEGGLYRIEVSPQRQVLVSVIRGQAKWFRDQKQMASFSPASATPWGGVGETCSRELDKPKWMISIFGVDVELNTWWQPTVECLRVPRRQHSLVTDIAIEGVGLITRSSTVLPLFHSAQLSLSLWLLLWELFLGV